MEIKKRAKIMAAEEQPDPDRDFPMDEGMDEIEVENTDGMEDKVDEIADDLEDLQDTIDDVAQDDVDIDIDNNITDHYIAECERCKGVFISAVTKTDYDVDMISGECPLCGHDTDQYLKWVIEDA